MESEQFSLCWNNFHSNLSSGFNALFQDECFVDVTLAAAGRYIKAHKTVLSVCSPFFKELFQANPNKHPIVILPEVNYEALCSLLQFMYQGEVSVNQEEIPTFMKVAEMLKVKGLTDDNSSTSESNGFSSASSGTYNFPDQRQVTKRPKILKRPSAKPENSRISHSPTHVKRACIEEIPSAKVNEQQKSVSLIKPKEEPIDPGDDTSEEPNPEDNSMDLQTILDAKLGESPNWLAATDGERPHQDSSTPGTLQCILGKRGNPRLIVDGYVFYKKSVYKGKAFWYCKNNRMTEKCQAVCWTMNGNIVKWPHSHTHPAIPDVFNPDEDSEVPIQNLQEILWQTSLN